jgi:hypothetical protein
MKLAISHLIRRQIVYARYLSTKPVYGSYRRAIVREIDDSLAQDALRMDSLHSSIDMMLARDQHHQYVDALRYFCNMIAYIDGALRFSFPLDP